MEGISKENYRLLKATCKGSIKAVNEVLIYDLYEDIIETILLSLEALFINLNI